MVTRTHVWYEACLTPWRVHGNMTYMMHVNTDTCLVRSMPDTMESAWGHDTHDACEHDMDDTHDACIVSENTDTCLARSMYQSNDMDDTHDAC